MEPGHREPLDQLFKRWLDLLFDPLLEGAQRTKRDLPYHAPSKANWSEEGPGPLVR